MTRTFKSTIAAVLLVGLSGPALSQAEPEEARTTYQVTFLKFAPGADDRWTEISEKNYAPARKTAGLPETQVHWMMDGPWDIMLVTRLPRGMATIDAHVSPERAAVRKALVAQLGSEAAADALDEENGKLIANSMRVYSHTHP
ncbi:hypothetical protein ACWPM1_14350 [Tsuneonella sp. HG249]